MTLHPLRTLTTHGGHAETRPKRASKRVVHTQTKHVQNPQAPADVEKTHVLDPVLVVVVFDVI